MTAESVIRAQIKNLADVPSLKGVYHIIDLWGINSEQKKTTLEDSLLLLRNSKRFQMATAITNGTQQSAAGPSLKAAGFKVVAKKKGNEGSFLYLHLAMPARKWWKKSDICVDVEKSSILGTDFPARNHSTVFRDPMCCGAKWLSPPQNRMMSTALQSFGYCYPLTIAVLDKDRMHKEGLSELALIEMGYNFDVFPDVNRWWRFAFTSCRDKYKKKIKELF